jgi:hypothetical protein
MTASFPWYDLPDLRWATDAIWNAMYPDAVPLDRKTPYDQQWRSPDLVVSQACGLDLFVGELPIEPIFAPVFDLPDCPEGDYFSYLVGRPGSGVAAVNSVTSRSGFSSLLSCTKPGKLLLTGSHRGSIRAVRDGHADFASIDAVIWHLLKRESPEELGDVEIAGRTTSAKAPPYVIRAGSNDDVRERLAAAMTDPRTEAARSALLLRRIVPVTRDDYAGILHEYESIRHSIPERISA